MRITSFAALLLVSGPVLSAPFVVSGPSTDLAQPTHCGVFMDTAARTEVAVAKDANGKSFCKVDIASISTGSHTIRATFVIKDAIWGSQESAQSAPFSFVRPALPNAPAGLNIAP